MIRNAVSPRSPGWLLRFVCTGIALAQPVSAQNGGELLQGRSGRAVLRPHSKESVGRLERDVVLLACVSFDSVLTVMVQG